MGRHGRLVELLKGGGNLLYYSVLAVLLLPIVVIGSLLERLAK